MLLLIILSDNQIIIRKKTSHKLGVSTCKILLGSRWLPNSFKRARLPEHLRMPGKDLSQITLSRWEKFCFAMLDLPIRWGWMRPTWANPQPMGN